jgi:hypothetical protein
MTMVALGASTAMSGPAGAAEVRPIVFPVEGKVSYTDSFGAPRSGHTHEGQDLMGTKLQHLLAAATGTVSYVKIDPAGNMFVIKDAQGWEYWYLHVNNDSPGTDDGANPSAWILAPGVAKGAHVVAGQFVGFLGDSGNAETTAPHLHFEIHMPGGAVVNPYASLQAANRNLPDGTWYERNGLVGGAADTTFAYGRPGETMLSCDWNGDGTDTPASVGGGVFKIRDSNTAGSATSAIAFGNTNTTGIADAMIAYGITGDRPVVGDWNADGKDTIGIFRQGSFYLRNTLTSGVADVTFIYGIASDQPFVGDWNADGVDTIGVFRAGKWFLRNTNTSGIAEFTFYYGTGNDIAVPGDFNGDTADTVGVWRPVA